MPSPMHTCPMLPLHFDHPMHCHQHPGPCHVLGCIPAAMPQHHTTSHPHPSRCHHAALTPAPCSTSASCLMPAPYSTLCHPSHRFPQISNILVEPLPNNYINSGCCLLTACTPCHIMVMPAPTSPHPCHWPSPMLLSNLATTATPDAPHASPMCYSPYPHAPASPMHHTLISSRIPMQLHDLGHHLMCPAIPSASHSLWPHHTALCVTLYRAHGPFQMSPHHCHPSLPMLSSS